MGIIASPSHSAGNTPQQKDRQDGKQNQDRKSHFCQRVFQPRRHIQWSPQDRRQRRGDQAALRLLPLPARNERGEGWGEGKSNKNATPLPGPLLLLRRKRGRKALSIPLIQFQRGAL